MNERLTPTQARMLLREILAGDECVRPASVYDALTARAAARLGFRLGMLGGSVAALAVLGAPDHALLSLDEFAALCRRICRARAVPLIVDADHGFGTALHAMRAVEELEAAGIAGMTLEDTALPRPFGATGPDLVSPAEAVAKVEAALSARTDPSFVIVARTDARLQGMEGLVSRAEAFGAIGADALFISGAEAPEQIVRAQQAAQLPVIVPEPAGALAAANLADLGIRICLTPHKTLPAATAAAWDSLAAAAGAQPVTRPVDLMTDLSDGENYDHLISRYLSDVPS